MNRRHEADSVTVSCAAIDPTPAARALAVSIQRRLTEPEFAETARTLSGSHLIASDEDPRGNRVSCDEGAITIDRGPAVGAAEESSDPAVASWVAVLQDRPDSTWEEAAQRYWALAAALPGAPKSLILRPLDGSAELRLGDSSGEAYEIHGDPEDLVQVLSGEVLLIDAACNGQVKIVGTLPELSVLSGACMDMLMGEWR